MNEIVCNNYKKLDKKGEHCYEILGFKMRENQIVDSLYYRYFPYKTMIFTDRKCFDTRTYSIAYMKFVIMR